MKKYTLIIFFSFHLILVFFQGLNTTIDGYWSYHYNNIPDVPVLRIFKQNRFTDPYYILTGINTGYGFYGIKTSSKKFLRLTFLDSTQNLIKFDRYFGLTTSNGVSRLNGYASYLANHIADTQKLIEKDSLSQKKDADVIKFRKNYVTKSMKWLGKPLARNLEECYFYKVELLTIIPEEVKEIKNNSKPELYVIQEGFYSVQ
jgi:hypothetical protein